MPSGQLVLLDTSIIIEAFRTGCWNALSTHFLLETVEKCVEEALTGDRYRPGYVEIAPDKLRNGLKAQHPVSIIERAKLALSAPGADGLDDGERDLFAHALGRTDRWQVSASDKAAINIALGLGWEDRVSSLEVLARAAGARPALKPHYCEKWLSGVRTDHALSRPLG